MTDQKIKILFLHDYLKCKQCNILFSKGITYDAILHDDKQYIIQCSNSEEKHQNFINIDELEKLEDIYTYASLK